MSKQFRNLRILLLTTDIGLGGAERVWNQHSIALSSFFHVEQAVFEFTPNPGYRSNLALHNLVICPIILRLGSFPRFIQRVIALHCLVKSRKIDLVISHLEGANLVNVVSFSRAKKILVLHGSAKGDLNHRRLYKFLRLHLLMPFVYRSGDAVVGVSTGTAAEIKHYAGIDSVYSIPNFFDVGTIEEKAKLSIPECFTAIYQDRPVLITSGRLSKQKNQAFLFLILEELKLRNRDVSLVIMGDGEMRKDLIDLAARSQLSTYSSFGEPEKQIDQEYDVYFVGYQDNPFAWLAKSTLFLFPSLWEGHPLALCEALICKIPVISSDCPNGPREMLAPHEPFDPIHNPVSTAVYSSNGVLMPMSFNTSTAMIWADVIEHLIAMPHKYKRLANSGYKYAQTLSPEVILPQWLDLICKTI